MAATASGISPRNREYSRSASAVRFVLTLRRSAQADGAGLATPLARESDRSARPGVEFRIGGAAI